MKDIEEASDRALKGIESILSRLDCCAPFDLILEAWFAMNRMRKG